MTTPSISLVGLKTGTKVTLRNGRTGTYAGANHTFFMAKEYPHICTFSDGKRAYTDDGLYNRTMNGKINPLDIVKVG